MSPQSFAVAFFTIGDWEGLSGDDIARNAHLDIPADCLPVAATLQSARQWLSEQHTHIDMECAAELPLRGSFSFQSAESTDSFHIESAQLVALDEGFVVRADLDNGVCVESDLIAINF